MKKVKSYTHIWNVEKVIYAINDLKLPFPVTFHQMAWFVLTLMLVMMFSSMPPLVWIQGAFLKYLGIPVFCAWFLSQKSFDGKKPLGFLRSILLYYATPKVTFAGKKVRVQRIWTTAEITYVRRNWLEVSD